MEAVLACGKIVKRAALVSGFVKPGNGFVIGPRRGRVDVARELCDPQAERVNLGPRRDLDGFSFFHARAILLVGVVVAWCGFLAFPAQRVQLLHELLCEIVDRRSNGRGRKSKPRG